MDREHEHLVVEDGNVHQTLRVLGLPCLLQRGEARIAVLFVILKNCINDFITLAHLNNLERAFLFCGYVFEDRGLQVAICDEYSTPDNGLECLLVSSEDLKKGIHRHL